MEDENKKEELEVTEEIKDLFLTVRAAEACRDVSIKTWFGTKRALQFSKQAITAANEAWRQVGLLYPQTKEGVWIYSITSKTVKRKEQAA